jgi:hypothetical protein
MRLISSEFIVSLAPVGVRIKPYSDGFADTFDRYENRGRVHTMDPSLRAKRSNPEPRRKTGLLRRFAPRNDGKAAWRTQMPGNRNLMFLIIGALIVVVGLLGYNLYEAKKEPKGVQINVGPDGLKIQNK